jgi:hypothetical protein
MMIEEEWWISLARIRACSPLGLVGECLDVNLRPGGTLRWKAEYHQLGRAGRGLWKVGTSKVVAPLV